MDSLYKHIITFVQLTDSINQLRLLRDALYKNQTSPSEEMETRLPVYFVEYIQQYARESAIDMSDVKALQILIDNIRQNLETTPVAELKIGFTPSYKTVTKIAEWWREWAHKFVVISIIIDEQTIAGMQVSYNGTFGDYSLRRWFDQKGVEFVEKAVQ